MPAPPGTKLAVFLDRDGTIIEDLDFIDDPAKVALMPGAPEAIRRFRDADFLVVVVSNQSGVARGMFDESTVHAVNDRLQMLLSERGVRIDAFYYCPYLDDDDAVVDRYREDSDWRKPEPGMLLAAASDLGIDLTRSWMIGDAPRDVEAGRRAGCQTILVSARENGPGQGIARCDHHVTDVLEAAAIVEREMKDSDDKSVSSAPSSAGDKVDNDSAVPLLVEIRDLLDRSARRQRQADFSLLRLLGSLLQMLAVVMALWGLAALLGDRGPDATPRFALACFLQLAAMTSLVADRFK